MNSPSNQTNNTTTQDPFWVKTWWVKLEKELFQKLRNHPDIKNLPAMKIINTFSDYGRPEPHDFYINHVNKMRTDPNYRDSRLEKRHKELDKERVMSPREKKMRAGESRKKLSEELNKLKAQVALIRGEKTAFPLMSSLEDIDNKDFWEAYNNKELWKIGAELWSEGQTLVDELWQNAKTITADNKNWSMGDCPSIIADIEGYNSGMHVSTNDGEGYISIAVKRLEKLKNDLPKAKAIFAHEIAHIMNGDTSRESHIANESNIQHDLKERFAERLGAIIYGNPREYFRIFSASEEIPKEIPDFKTEKEAKTYIDAIDMSQALSQEALCLFNGCVTFERKKPSWFGRQRMIKKWVDILEKTDGVVDKTSGEIVDYQKAFDLFEQYKKVTSDFAEVEQFSYLSQSGEKSP